MVVRTAILVIFLIGCAPAVQPARAIDLGAFVSLPPPSASAKSPPGDARLTVLVFFSSSCHCLVQHEARLLALYEQYHPLGVDFFMIDSETSGSAERDTAEARRRGYPFPILLDRGAKLADVLEAQFATYSVVLDREGAVRYRGGIDSDKSHLHDNAQRYLQDAVVDLLAGYSPRVARGKTLGCALQTW
jgi:hypothetical protein